MNKTWDQPWGVRMQRILAVVTSIMLVSMVLLPGLAHAAAGDLTWSADTNVDLTTLDLVILSGSTAESFVVNDASVVVTTTGADSFTIRGAATTTRMASNSSLNPCVLASGFRQLTVTGSSTVTITPDSVACGGGGGGFSGGGVSVVTPSCSVTSPNGGQTLTGGQSTNITWSSSGNGIVDANLYYSVDGGSIWGLIKAGTANDGSEAWTVPNTATTNAKVKVECREGGGGTLASDASDSAFTIQLAGTLPTVPPPSQTGALLFSRTEANAKLPAAFAVDSLVKLPNDNNPNTYTDTTVYYIGLDAKRHPFPSLAVYNSWYADFSGVKTIDMVTIASIPLGNPVLVRPGTHWVKIQSDPKTYFVEPGYTLRWIKDEGTAVALGGSDWNKNIVDIEPTYFTKFKVGADISSASSGWPAASLVKKSTEGTVWYVTSNGRRALDAGAMAVNKWQLRFVETNDNGGWMSLPTQSNVSGFEDVLFSQLVP